jgi:hypothetical protein
MFVSSITHLNLDVPFTFSQHCTVHLNIPYAFYYTNKIILGRKGIW